MTTDILFWILPPIVGAFIGYSTNVVAIKMLFRPLAEVRLLGFRLPFTPGILPKERGKLAESIGQMVERELLTPGVLRERLAKTEVREKIENAIGGYSGQLLDRPLSFWLEEGMGDSLLTELLRNFVNSDIFDCFLEEIIKNWLLGAPVENADDNFGSMLRSRFRDIGGIFVPTARGLLKSGLVKEIKNQSFGKPPMYKMALEKVIAKYPNLSTREFLSMGASNKKKLDMFLTEKTTATLDDNIEGALSSVNVRVLVSDRINSLDMIKVERIILDVMAGQLKWINFFGGILGALIGFSQVLLSLLYPRLAG